MAVGGESRASGPDVVWLEHSVRIPLEQYSQLRSLLGNLAATYGAKISAPPDVRMNDQPVVYNERKVTWVEDIGRSGHRPMIPFAQLMERENVSDGMAAMSLISAVRHAASRALESGEQSELLAFVHSEPAPSEWFQYDIQGVYADRALELAYGGDVLEQVPGVSRLSIAVFREFCADLVLPAPPAAS